MLCVGDEAGLETLAVALPARLEFQDGHQLLLDASPVDMDA